MRSEATSHAPPAAMPHCRIGTAEERNRRSAAWNRLRARVTSRRRRVLRRSGWKGFGPVPWAHEPNRGFLRALAALHRAAAAIGELDEAERTATFLADSDPAAPAALGLA